MNPQNEQDLGNTAVPVTPIVTAEGQDAPTDSSGGTIATEPTTPVTATHKNLVPILIAVVVLALIGGGYYFMKAQNDDSVAVVNGFKIARKEFDESVNMIKQNASLQGVDLTDPNIETKIKNQAVETLVNNALLIGRAKAAGIIAEDTEIQSEYNTLAESLGGEETLKTRMTEVGLTEEKLRNNIHDRIIVDTYIESKTDIESLTVTDEEVQAFLDSIKTEGAELPPLEEIRPQIEMQILSEKQQVLVNNLITELRSQADIEVKI